MALCLTASIKDGSGALFSVPYVPPNLQRVAINFNTSGDHALVSGVAAQTIKVYKIVLQAAAAMTLKLKDGASYLGDATWELGIGGSVMLDLDKYAHYELGANNALAINSDTAALVSGYVLFLQS